MNGLKDIIPSQSKGIVFFDGLCPICHGSIYLLTRLDPKTLFVVSPLEGATAKKIGLNRNKDTFSSHSSVILITRDGRRLEKSKAILMILSELSYPAKCLSIFRILPEWLLDGVYTLIAKYRYVFFKKKIAAT